MKKLKAKIWMINRYGLRKYLIYMKDHREGIEIDYSKIFSPEEIEILKSRGLLYKISEQTLYKTLEEIRDRPFPERNPDGEEQWAESVKLLASEALQKLK